ncbi:hypothetical protein A3B19_00385 [Candidatus Giovannonibacteria bacterium RIFCSPLOWO2_01_FULL_46_32]|uniref:Uncharacterized protein n=1 Tax=Candidatus Giovannonibacteria bacterium RIFCSPLOWO2_01_FULL_46_32 TaxID=1798353 RepID=A0A1F5XFR4_9BACT|nr:MAG: hypothetical protein A3B19_00385 [Candidatus Giovannonibacteria bacterium RIFCSPLOWO2_01_FULL_46_32]
MKLEYPLDPKKLSGRDRKKMISDFNSRLDEIANNAEKMNSDFDSQLKKLEKKPARTLEESKKNKQPERCLKCKEIKAYWLADACSADFTSSFSESLYVCENCGGIRHWGDDHKMKHLQIYRNGKWQYPSFMYNPDAIDKIVAKILVSIFYIVTISALTYHGDINGFHDFMGWTVTFAIFVGALFVIIQDAKSS